MRMLRVSLATTLLISGLAALPAQAQEASADRVVMFSTDYGLGIIGGATNGPDRHAADVDDAYAVTLALPSSDVQAIVTTFGNDKARPSAESARRGLTALGVPAEGLVVAGAEGFLDAEAVSFVPSSDSDGATVFCVNEGVERMRDVLEANDAGSVTLFAIGPFTDIACLQRAFPASYARLGEIIALVGSSDGTLTLGGIDVVDFNFAMDPTALGEVVGLGGTVPLTFLMFEVTQLGTLSNETIDGWLASGTEAQRFYAAASQPHAAYWDAIFTDTDGQALFDAHTVYYFLQPDAYVCEDDMLATATVAGYPDTSASTTKNTLSVVASDGETPPSNLDIDGSTYTYSGPVRGCSAFATADGVAAFEGAVADSVAVIEG